MTTKVKQISESIFDFGSYIKIGSCSGSQIIGLCPFHNDRNPSFSCNTETGLWKCFAGCGAGDFAKFVFMFEQQVQKFRPDSYNSARRQETFFDWSGYRHVATHYYDNREMQTVFRVRRYENPTKGKVFIQEHKIRGNWIKGKYPGDLLPYLCRHWMLDRGNRLLFFVEGEKCADLLHQLGLAATTVPGGVNGWHKKFGTRVFDGRKIVILPDNDEAGMKFGQYVRGGLTKLGHDARIVILPGLSQGEDVVDWIASGRSCDDLIRLATQLQE